MDNAMASEPLKISVLSSGDLLLDGQAVTLEGLETAMDGAAKAGAPAWYYPENAAGDPPAAAMEVMKLTTKPRLPIRLSSKPDFSDSVTSATPELDQMFAAMREKAAQHKIIILQPNGKHTLLPAPD